MTFDLTSFLIGALVFMILGAILVPKPKVKPIFHLAVRDSEDEAFILFDAMFETFTDALVAFRALEPDYKYFSIVTTVEPHILEVGMTDDASTKEGAFDMLERVWGSKVFARLTDQDIEQLEEDDATDG